jgi:hypothetical protein
MDNKDKELKDWFAEVEANKTPEQRKEEDKVVEQFVEGLKKSITEKV